jgi:pimeloyl-ACP methyl ester carboxylesterase
MRTADGRALAYERVGEGPLLVCHPGGPGLSSRYLTDLGGLADRFTLVELDPRGTGGSTRPDDPGAYRIEDYVADVEELRAHLGLERMLLLGYSHGGVVALAYAAAHPGRVERLVVVCGSARFHAEQEEATRQAVERRAGEPWFERASAALALDPSDGASEEELRVALADMLPLYFHRWDARARAYAAEVASEVPNGDAMALWSKTYTAFDLRPQLPAVEAPTLVLTGEDDFVTGPVCAREVAALVPGAELAIFPECGHMLWVEQRDLFRDAVERFLAG